MRPAVRTWAAAAIVLLSLSACARAGGSKDDKEEEQGSAASVFGEGAAALDRFFNQKPKSVEESPSPPPPGEGEGEDKPTIAQRLDGALKEEFKEEEKKKEEVGQHFNETVESNEGTQETVVIISSSKKKSNVTEDSEGSSSSSSSSSHSSDPTAPRHVAGGTGSLGEGAALSADRGGSGAEGELTEAEERKKDLEEQIEAAAETDVDRIIDSKDNEYVLSKPSDDSMGMNLDPQFVKDLTVLIAASAGAGLVMASLGQPAINGYFIAGSLVGPGGLKLIKEIVQVQSVAQLGVQLLLFTLGLEFSLTKLRAVRNVALLGGLLQTAMFAMLAGLGAKLIGTSPAQGAFVGAMVAMSSTSIVVKVLNETRTQNTQQGQITIGTLILQDCLVGLLFAFIPVLVSAGGGGGFNFSLLVSVMARVVGKLAILATVALMFARTILPPATRWLARRFGADSFQLATIAFCLLCALATARQGISAELGAFVAGIMLSATEQQETILHHLEPVTQFFLALFISSTGMVLSPVFLIDHLLVLAAGALVIIVSKTVLIAAVVSAFKYPADTALAVGMNLSQIGEFVFVLLSVANQQALVAENVYMLLMGITALSLLLTPFLLQLSNKLVMRSRSGLSASDLEMAGLVGNGLQSSPAVGPESSLADGQGDGGVDYRGCRIPAAALAAAAGSMPGRPPSANGAAAAAVGGDAGGPNAAAGVSTGTNKAATAAAVAQRKKQAP